MTVLVLGPLVNEYVLDEPDRVSIMALTPFVHVKPTTTAPPSVVPDAVNENVLDAVDDTDVANVDTTDVVLNVDQLLRLIV